MKSYLTNIKGSAASMSGYNVSLQGSITGFTKVSDAIKQYNALGTASQQEQQAFANAVSATNSKLGTYLIGLNGSTASLRSYGVSLAVSTAKTIGLTVATAALNAVMTMGISLIVTGLISAFTAWINKSEEITKKAQEAADKINSISESLKTNTETVENAKRRYAELAQEVENLGKITQSQGTLSNEEYEEFLDLSNQLAGIFPSLTKNYDENGNAILDLSGDVNTIVSSLDDLIQKEKELANQQIMEEFPAVFKGYAQDVSDAEEKVKSAQTEFDKINNAYQQLSNGSTAQAFDLQGNGWFTNENGEKITLSMGEYIANLEALGLKYEKTQLKVKNQFGGDTIAGYLVEATGDIDTAFTSKLETARENLQYAQQQLEGEKSSIDSYLNTWLQGEFSYVQIEDSGLQTAIQDMLFNFDFSNIPENKRGDWNYVSEYLRRNILFEINKVQDDPVISKAISEVFTNAELTPGEKANYLQQIQDFFGEDSAIVISLKPQIEETETLQKQYDDAVTKFGENSQKILEIFFKDNSINDSSEIDYWNNVTEGAKTAEEAVKMYNDAKKNGDEPDILSFSDVWNSEDFEDARKELLSLAEAGQLTPETLQSTEKYKTLLEQTGLSSEAAAKKINSMVDSATQLQSMSAQISKMSDMLADKKNGTTASADDLASFNAEIRGLDSWAEFEKVMMDSKSSMEDCQSAANALATEWVNNGNFLANLTDETKQAYITQLDKMGVDNAEAVVEAKLAAIHREEALALQYATAAESYNATEKGRNNQITTDFLNITGDEINALAQAGGEYLNTANDIAVYKVQKAMANKTTLDTAADIRNLADLAGAATKLGKLLNQLALIKEGATNGMPSYIAEKQAESLQSQIEALVGGGSNDTVVDIPVEIKPTGSQNYKPPGGTDKRGSDSKDTKQTVDWISRLLEVLQKKIDATKAKFDNLFTLKDKKNNLAEQIKLIKNLLTATTIAAERYKKAADKVGLSKELKTKVKNGSYDITEYGSKTAEKIQKYQEYIDRYDELKQQEEELNAEIRNLKIEQKQLYVDDADARKELIDSEIELVTSGKNKNKLEKDKIKYIKQSYNKQIEIAKIEKDSVKVSQLRIDKEKELLAVKKEILQNTLDQNDKEMALLDAKYQNATSAKEKNKILDKKDTISSKNVEAYRTDYRDAKKNVTSSGKTATSSTNSAKSLSDSDRKKINSYVNKGKKVPDSLLKKVKALDEEWYDLLVQYNSKYTTDYSSVVNAIKKSKVSQKTQDSLEKAVSAGKSISKTTLENVKKKDTSLYKKLSDWNKGQQNRADIVSTISSTKTLTSSDKKKIKSLVNSKKPITDSLLQKVASANPSLYAELVDYNNKLDYLDESEYNLDVAKEQDKTDKANNAKEQFNNLQSQYENRISILNSKAESLNGQMEMVEARGYVVNGDYYNKLIKNTQSNLSELSGELVELRNKRDEMLKDGLEKGSDDWYEIQNAIWSVKNAQDDATKSIIEYQKQIRQLKWDAFDRQEDFISKIQDEGNFLIDLMSNEKLFADDGNWTEYANAIAGLRAMNYNAYMAQANDYEKEIQAIQQEINNDPYNIDLIQRKQELISTQRELIKSAYDEKDAIKSLVSDGYNKWLDSLEKSISLRKKELDEQKDYKDYFND